MPGAKEIRSKIKSIGNTQKITRAMEMVAASKMRKAQDRMTTARPYAERILQVIRHVGYASSEYRHPFLEERQPKRYGLIIVSTDRGLCGGLNVNLFRAAIGDIREARNNGLEVDICTLGSKAFGFFKRIGADIVAQADHLGDSPGIQDLIGTVKVMLDSYTEERIDGLAMVHNVFVNSMTQQPRIVQLLPLKVEDNVPGDYKLESLEPTVTAGEDLTHHWDYIYEPDAKEVLDHLLMRYIESQVYRGVVENIACEQAARMVAMKAATENAGELIDELQLAYNKARQAAITQEISEIVSGAAAV